MKNSILKLSGAQELSKREQKTVVGGITQEMAACLSRGCVMSSASPILIMKNSILKLSGAQELSKGEQKSLNGGRRSCNSNNSCGAGQCCSSGVCYPYGTPGHLCTYYPEF
ncbi:MULTISPECIES: hypothetical protein [Flavobacterium]|uniref:hypothetical protein n=2 Tax=Flavobacterium TaxID=237 RepID=UPI001F3245AF|nr:MULTISPECIES: hypothetical protein [Flavobacterium]